MFKRKYKIIPYHGGYAIYVKNSWFNRYKKYDNCYFSILDDAWEWAKKEVTKNIEKFNIDEDNMIISIY